jgi:hypothetical protein
MSGSPFRSASSSVSGESPGRLCSATIRSRARWRLDSDPGEEPSEEDPVLVQADGQGVAKSILGLIVLVEEVPHAESGPTGRRELLSRRPGHGAPAPAASSR